MTITVYMPPEGRVSVDPRAAATHLTASEQRRLFKRIGRYISNDDCQRALDDLAQAITESRVRAAREVLEGKWPVEKPIPVEALKRFYDAQPPIVSSVCQKPDILIDHENKIKMKMKKERS